MPAAAPDLVPLFRSGTQMRLLVEIFHGRPASGADLARRLRIPQPTVARELARLENVGLITMDPLGTAKVARPVTSLPYFVALRQLLAFAGGLIPAVAEAYATKPGVVEIFIFGSWARRFHGDPGPPPNDIDIAIVSDSLTSFDVAEERLRLEGQLGLTIDQFVLGADNARVDELRRGSVPVLDRRRS